MRQPSPLTTQQWSDRKPTHGQRFAHITSSSSYIIITHHQLTSLNFFIHYSSEFLHVPRGPTMTYLLYRCNTHIHLTHFKIHSNFLSSASAFFSFLFFSFSFTTFSFSLKKRKNEWHKQNDCLNRACSQKIVLFRTFVQMTIPMTAGVAAVFCEGCYRDKAEVQAIILRKNPYKLNTA